MLTVVVAAVVDPLTASAVYLFITPFHGYLELVVLACWLAESPLSTRTAAATRTQTGWHLRGRAPAATD